MPSADEIRQKISALGKYEIVMENTEGASAYAFRARHLPLACDTFLKVYDVDPDAGDLYREARVLKEICDQSGCENLVRVLDAERLADDQVLIAMEFIDGGSLLSCLQRSGPFALMDAIVIVRGVIRGVAELHVRNLVHRDLKPANVLLDSQRNIAKIGDFGSIGELDEHGISTRTSKRSALYIPPEGWLCPPQHMRASDLYQIGVVLHELVHGPLPYDAESHLDAAAMREIRTLGGLHISDLDHYTATIVVDHAIERRARRRKLLSMTKPQLYVPDALTRIIRRATSPDSGQRFATATDFLAALERIDAPNWRREGDLYVADAWRHADWRIAVRNGSSVAERRLSAGFRFWKEVTNPQVLFDAVGDQPSR